LTTIQRVFLRLVRPSFAIEQMDKYWRRFHDTGAWTIDRRDREVTAKLTGWGVIDAALCRELVGYLGRTLELLGGRDVCMDHRRCRGRGDESCEFHARFRAAGDRAEAEGPSSEVASSASPRSAAPQPASTPLSRPPPNSTPPSGQPATPRSSRALSS
jgi:hypothetical protein